MSTVLLLRTCNADGTSHGGFRWPDQPGTEVIAPDWDPKPECGNGLHGNLWGGGDHSLFSPQPDARWQVVSAPESSLVDLTDKHKVPRCVLVYSGTRDGATAYLRANGCALPIGALPGEVVSSTGNGATSSSTGYWATSSSTGEAATSSSTGYWATSSSTGYMATSSSTGYMATSSSTGYMATSSSAGDMATSSSTGYWGLSTATGSSSIARAGDRGLIVLLEYSKSGAPLAWRVGEVGVNGCKPDTWYEARDGRLYEVPASDERVIEHERRMAALMNTEAKPA